MSVASHYDASAASYADQYDPQRLLTNAEYPANYFRLELVKRLLTDAGARSAYEFGVGDATPLVRIAALGLEVAGNDLSSGMVEHARANMSAHGLDPMTIAHIDVQDSAALSKERDRYPAFDAVLALGVIPHVADDEAFVRDLGSFARPGGRMILQFRNALFAMYTFNRLTKEFVLDELLADVESTIRDAVATDLDRRLAVDMPPIRRRPDGNGYDEILARFHNPFELAEVVRRSGFSDIRYHWYNAHPAYPMLASQIDPERYRRAAMALEGDIGWRGMFLCSAGIIEAVKHGGASS